MKYQLQANAIAPLLARTISLGMALDDVKDEWLSIQKEQSQDQKRIMNMVTACCVIKESDTLIAVTGHTAMHHPTRPRPEKSFSSSWNPGIN